MDNNLAKHSEKLNYFYLVTEYGSLQAAGRKIGISAPTLSYAIKELEALLRVSLFLRSRKGMELTIEGQKLKSFCRRYYLEMQTLAEELISPAIQPKRKIKIGIFPSIAIYFWPLVHEQQQRHSEVSISLKTNRSHAVLESLVHREVDVAVTVDTIKHDHMVQHKLYDDTYSFYVSEKKLKGKTKNFSVRDQVLIYLPDAKDLKGKTLDQYILSSDLRFKDYFEMDSFEVIAEFVDRGYGIGILPNRVAKSMAVNIKKVRPTNEIPMDFGSHHFYLTHRDDLDLPNKIIEELVGFVQKAVKLMNAP